MNRKESPRDGKKGQALAATTGDQRPTAGVTGKIRENRDSPESNGQLGQQNARAAKSAKPRRRQRADEAKAISLAPGQKCKGEEMRLIAIGMLAATCTGAVAETVSASIDRYTFSPLIVQMPGVDLHAGQYQARIDGRPETAWCAEVGQFLQFGSTVEYRVVDADVAFGRSIAGQLDAILSYAATGHPVDARESADMQVDVWRAISEEPLSGLYTSPLTVEAFLLTNVNRQDLIVGRPYVAIDEPEPGLLLLLGIGIMAIRSRYGS